LGLKQVRIDLNGCNTIETLLVPLLCKAYKIRVRHAQFLEVKSIVQA